MSGTIERAFLMLELLATRPEGLSVVEATAELGLAPSACHRLLNELVRLGYARQLREQGDYALTIRFAGLGLAYLARAGISDVAQPVLDDLAGRSGELVRLSVSDGGRLVWVGVAQGATAGLRYDPGREQGAEVDLAYSATGRAWLSALSEEGALKALAQSGLVPPADGAGRVIGMGDLLAIRGQAVAQGYAVAVDTFLTGMASIAAPVRGPDGRPVGCLSIAGPAVRLTEARMQGLAPALIGAAARLGEIAAGSAFFRGRA